MVTKVSEEKTKFDNRMKRPELTREQLATQTKEEIADGKQKTLDAQS